MAHRIRLAGAFALAAAPALAASPTGAATPASGEVGNERVRNCATEALTPAQLATGATSVVICDDTSEGALGVSRLAASAWRGAPTALGSTVLAVHASGTGGYGDQLTVYGSACDGSGMSFAAGDSWNDRIQSTRHAACPNVKHWVDANFGGASQLTQGAPGVPVDLNATLARNVSSIRYYGS